MNLRTSTLAYTITYLAVSEDVEEQRQALVHELRRVVIRPDLEEVLQQLVDDVLQTVLVGRGQGVHPTVEGPRHAQVTQVQRDLCNGGGGGGGGGQMRWWVGVRGSWGAAGGERPVVDTWL